MSDSLLSILENTKFGQIAMTDASGITPYAYQNMGFADFSSNRSFTFPAGCFGFCGFNSSNFSNNFGFSCSSFSCSSFNSSDFANNFGFSCSSFFCSGFDSSFFTTNFTFKNFTPTLKPISDKILIQNTDHQDIYDNLHSTQAQYGIAQSPIPTYTEGQKATTDMISTLKDYISAMSSNAHISSNASTSSVTVPARGSLASYNPMIELNNIITKIHDNCINFIGTSS